MARVVIEAITWDSRNLAHIKRATPDEIEQAIENHSTVVDNHRGKSGDLMMWGQTIGGRWLCVIVAYDELTRTVRPITAWDGRPSR